MDIVSIWQASGTKKCLSCASGLKQISSSEVAPQAGFEPAFADATARQASNPSANANRRKKRR
jgi:hypothetical protein